MAQLPFPQYQPTKQRRGPVVLAGVLVLVLVVVVVAGVVVVPEKDAEVLAAKITG